MVQNEMRYVQDTDSKHERILRHSWVKRKTGKSLSSVDIVSTYVLDQMGEC